MLSPRSILAAVLTVGCAYAATDAENVALKGIEAMNRNQGEAFVVVAHTKFIQNLRDTMVARVEKAAQGEIVPKEVADHYGVSSVKGFRALTPEFVVRVTIDHMSDHEPARLRDLMRKAVFALLDSRSIDAETTVVRISVDLGEGGPLKTVEVISKVDGEKWKYWGYPELTKK